MPSEIWEINGLRTKLLDTFQITIATHPNQSISSGVSVGTGRVQYPIYRACAGVILEYTNCSNVSTGEVDAPAAVTFKAAIEVAGVVYPVFFKNGARSIAVDPGGRVQSDPCMVPQFVGTPLIVRTCVTPVSNFYYTQNTSPTAGNAVDPVINIDGFIAGQDYTDSGTVTIVNNGRTVAPARILGVGIATGASCLIVGDSIAHGTGDIHPNRLGFIRRAMYGLSIPRRGHRDGRRHGRQLRKQGGLTSPNADGSRPHPCNLQLRHERCRRKRKRRHDRSELAAHMGGTSLSWNEGLPDDDPPTNDLKHPVERPSTPNTDRAGGRARGAERLAACQCGGRV